jgi:flavodoxin
MIGLIYYSQTGHTAKVMRQLAEHLQGVGEAAEMVALEPAGAYSAHDVTVSLKELPDLSGYDRLVLGTPVYGGRMAAPVRAFLQEVVGLAGMPVMLLLTHFLPRQWGAVQTIAAMETLCTEKGAKVLGATDVTWFSLGRGKAIKGAVAQVVDVLSKAK